MRRRWWIVVIAGAVAVVALVVWPDSAPQAYLASALLASSVPLGSASALMVHNLTGGRWGDAVRERLELGAASAVLLPLLALPLIFFAPALWPWAEGEPHHPYFRAEFVAVRSAALLALWAVGGTLLSLASARVGRGERAGPRLRGASAVGLILHVVATAFAFTDWIAALQPGWHSSIFGALIVCSQALTALALAVGWRSAAIPTPALRDLAGLLLAFTLLHAYMHYSQFFIIWNGDVPHRASWYVPRAHGVWLWTIVLIALAQFVTPFVLLLSRRVKASAGAVSAVALLLIIGAALEAAWLTIPSGSLDGLGARWLYAPLAACVGAIVLAPALPAASREGADA